MNSMLAGTNYSAFRVPLSGSARGLLLVMLGQWASSDVVVVGRHQGRVSVVTGFDAKYRSWWRPGMTFRRSRRDLNEKGDVPVALRGQGTDWYVTRDGSSVMSLREFMDKVLAAERNCYGRASKGS